MIRKILSFFGLAALKAAAVAVGIVGTLFVMNIFLPFGDLNYLALVSGAFLASLWFTLVNATQKSRKLRKEKKNVKANENPSKVGKASPAIDYSSMSYDENAVEDILSGTSHPDFFQKAKK